MTKVVYEVVEHDGGWAYRVKDVYSETFPSYNAALKAANSAAQRQTAAGATTGIMYEDRDGHWHTEVAKGNDRPQTEVAP